MAVAPALFDMDECGTAHPRQPVIDPDPKLHQAISRCPTAAIEVDDGTAPQ
jgi:ferredoxin